MHAMHRFVRVHSLNNLSRYLWIIATLLVCAVWILYGSNATSKRIRYAFADTFDIRNASASELVLVGSQYFDSGKARMYDIERAQILFDRALSRDPTIPFAHHQLARIAFLRGDFYSALRLIDAEIALPGGPKSPSSYYIRGLIEGYMGAYNDSAHSYEEYLTFDPHNWAAINDYAWVLLKANRPKDAAGATASGLVLFPTNPWLLNTNATALYEVGDKEHARIQIMKAREAVQ